MRNWTGMGIPCPKELPNCYFGTHPRVFFDPYAGIDVEMMNELILTNLAKNQMVRLYSTICGLVVTWVCSHRWRK